MGMAFLESRREGETLELHLRGSWRASAIGAIREEFGAISLDGIREVRITQAGVERLDMAGAWVLDDLTRMLAVKGIGVFFTDEKLGALLLVRTALHATAEERPAAMRGEVNFSIVERLGRTTVERVQGLRDGLDFVGQNTVALLRVLGNWRRMRPISVARHVYDTGITAIPVVSLIAFLISVIVAYMAASQLRNYGADIYVVDLITVGVLRELGVLLTAIIVAGRTGSSFAAELGSMRLNEEVDALDATGVDPVESLVLPRILGLMIALPLLTVIADLVGIIGGATLCIWLLDMPVEQFISRASEAIGPTTFWAGLVKAPVFAVLIALAGTYRGLQVRGSARELGRLTTVAVVQSIFLVLLADALFAMVFLEIDF
jgi:phospholipid/cholesterol/gamma-HCH transport system permease protein